MRKNIFYITILTFMLFLCLAISSNAYSQFNYISTNKHVVYSNNIDNDLSHIIDVDSIAAEFDKYDFSLILIKIKFYGKAHDNSDSIDVLVKSINSMDDKIYFGFLMLPKIISPLEYSTELFENENKLCFEMYSANYFMELNNVNKQEVTFLFFKQNGKTIEGMSISNSQKPSEHLLEILAIYSNISDSDKEYLKLLLSMMV